MNNQFEAHRPKSAVINRWNTSSSTNPSHRRRFRRRSLSSVESGVPGVHCSDSTPALRHVSVALADTFSTSNGVIWIMLVKTIAIVVDIVAIVIIASTRQWGTTLRNPSDALLYRILTYSKSAGQLPQIINNTIAIIIDVVAGFVPDYREYNSGRHRQYTTVLNGNKHQRQSRGAYVINSVTVIINIVTDFGSGRRWNTGIYRHRRRIQSLFADKHQHRRFEFPYRQQSRCSHPIGYTSLRLNCQACKLHRTDNTIVYVLRQIPART